MELLKLDLGERVTRSDMIDHATALQLMESKIDNLNLRKHIRAVEAGMRQLARRFGEDE